jgi:hypothetical protein
LSSATQEKKTLMLVFLRLQETTMSLPTRHRLFVFFSSLLEDDDELKGSSLFFFSSLAKDDDELGSQLIVILDYFSSITKDDNKPPSLLSPFNFFPLVVQNNDKLGSWLVVVLDFFSLTTKDNNKPLNSLLFFAFVFSCRFYSSIDDNHNELGS